MNELQQIKNNTNLLREQKDELIIDIGHSLTERAFDINKIVLADWFTEDVAEYYVVIVTSEKKVFEFYYDFFNSPISKGKIIEWKDFTENPSGAYMAKSVKLALSHLDEILNITHWQSED